MKEHEPAIGEKESGRRELAAWVTDEHNPLTGRVYVNRVWGHLFGKGIANFGVIVDLVDPV